MGGELGCKNQHEHEQDKKNPDFEERKGSDGEGDDEKDQQKEDGSVPTSVYSALLQANADLTREKFRKDQALAALVIVIIGMLSILIMVVLMWAGSASGRHAREEREMCNQDQELMSAEIYNQHQELMDANRDLTERCLILQCEAVKNQTRLEEEFAESIQARDRCHKSLLVALGDADDLANEVSSYKSDWEHSRDYTIKLERELQQVKESRDSLEKRLRAPFMDVMEIIAWQLSFYMDIFKFIIVEGGILNVFFAMLGAAGFAMGFKNEHDKTEKRKRKQKKKEEAAAAAETAAKGKLNQEEPSTS